MAMTTAQALSLAQRLYPLDLSARVAYIDRKRDTCDADDLRAWTEAYDLMRNGHTA
jgi:hypothetical protein